MGKAENRIETYLRSEVEKLGGVCEKWTGTCGEQDQIVVFPVNIVHFCEVKTDSGVESPKQIRHREKFQALGCQCHVLYGKAGVNFFIEEMKAVHGLVEVSDA